MRACVGAGSLGLLTLVACLGLHAGDSCLCCFSADCLSPHRARKLSLWLGAALSCGLAVRGREGACLPLLSLYYRDLSTSDQC